MLVPGSLGNTYKAGALQLTLLSVKFMKQELLKVIPDRALEGIKGRRRRGGLKTMVERFLSEIRSANAETAPSPIVNAPSFLAEHSSESRPMEETLDDVSYEITRASVIKYLQRLPSCANRDYNSESLNRIVVSTWSKERLFEETSVYLRETFRGVRKSKRRIPVVEKPQSHRKLCRAEYARVQTAWKRNRASCMRDLLRDKRTSSAPSKEIMALSGKRL